MSSLLELVIGFVVNFFFKWQSQKSDDFKRCCRNFKWAKSNVTVYFRKKPLKGNEALAFLQRRLCAELFRVDEEDVEKPSANNDLLRLRAIRRGKDPEAACREAARKKALAAARERPLDPASIKIPQELRQYQEAALCVMAARERLRGKALKDARDALKNLLSSDDNFWWLAFRCLDGGGPEIEALRTECLRRKNTGGHPPR